VNAREEYVDEILENFENAVKRLASVHWTVSEEDLEQAMFEVAKARKVLLMELLES